WPDSSLAKGYAVPSTSSGALLCGAGDRRHGSSRRGPGADPPGAVGPRLERAGAGSGAEIPDRFAIMGWFYLDDPKGRDLVAHWKERPGMIGLRFYFNERHKREWMTDGSLDWLWPAVERAGVPVALAAALFLPTVGQIAEHHPGLKLIVDHMAVPPGSSGQSAYRFQPELLALAKYPNVAVKATGQPGYAEDAYPFRSFHQHLHRCFDAFGPERM